MSTALILFVASLLCQKRRPDPNINCLPARHLLARGRGCSSPKMTIYGSHLDQHLHWKRLFFGFITSNFWSKQPICPPLSFVHNNLQTKMQHLRFKDKPDVLACCHWTGQSLIFLKGIHHPMTPISSEKRVGRTFSACECPLLSAPNPCHLSVYC